MEKKIQEYVDIVMDGIDRTGSVTETDMERILCYQGIARGRNSEYVLKRRGHSTYYQDPRDAIAEAVDKDPHFIRENYLYRKSLEPQMEELLHKIIEMRIGLIRLVATGIDRYGALRELHGELDKVCESVFNEGSDLDLSYLDKMLWTWMENANSFTGLPKKYIDEIRSKSK